MSDLDQLAISRILGSTIQPFNRTDFGALSAVRAVGEMLATRPKPPARLGPDTARDKKIIKSFTKIHKGYSVDRVLADPELANQFVQQAQMTGVDAPAALIYRRLLAIRKAGELTIKTTVKEKRDLCPFLIPAELAFANLKYQYDASYDDLLADPEIGTTFDALAAKFGGTGKIVDHRLAALHLRKNIRKRRPDERTKLASINIDDLNQLWHFSGAVAEIALDSVPTEEGIFALSEPNRYLFLTKYSNMREGVERFRDPDLLAALSNRFWTPAQECTSLQFIERGKPNGPSLRLLELKALEIYRPIFNLLPVAA